MVKLLKILVCSACAFLLWAAFPPRGEVYGIAFALAPMLALSRLAVRPKGAAGWWFLFGFLYWFATLSWMPAICANNGPWPLVALGWVGLAAVCAGYFALFGWLDARLWRQMRGGWAVLVAVLVEPILWAGVEWLRATLFGGFAWNFLGTAVGQVPSLATPARVGGVYLVSALVILLNGVFATLIGRLAGQMRGEEDRWAGRKGARAGRLLETGLPLAAILAVLGTAPAVRTGEVDGTAYRPLRVALVQRNAPCVFTRGPREDPYETFDRLLAAAAAARPDLIVLGESAMSEFGPLVSENAAHAARFLSQRCGGAALLGGGDWRTPEDHLWNAAALYRFDEAAVTDGVAFQVYGKQHLVPFGEYIPCDKTFPVLQKLSPIGVSCWPGEPAVFTLPVAGPAAATARKSAAMVRLAPLICYEDTDPVLARQAARLGAQALTLITNDSWFGHSSESVQHAAQAVLRALETGLPVIRVGNSGVTGVISPSGRTRWLEDGEGRPLTDAAGCQLETVFVPAAPVLTPYSRLGDWPLILLFTLCAAFSLVGKCPLHMSR